eukprot:TRINITY_DN7278_c1_g1_i1.p1 TRINITY_DN7278_c1_g1~~TRINITY_DN7278_c1_g1_i1.p1  ORF type:complete len:441 (+),score=75.24 TRINITY_DN7278_c1_g1_i1:75-1397(+)
MLTKPMSMCDLVCVVVMFTVMVVVDGTPLIDICWKGEFGSSSRVMEKVKNGTCAMTDDPQHVITASDFFTLSLGDRICNLDTRTSRCLCANHPTTQKVLGSYTNLNHTIVVTYSKGLLSLTDLFTSSTLNTFTVPVEDYLVADMNDGGLQLFYKTSNGTTLAMSVESQQLYTGYSCESTFASDTGNEVPIRGVTEQQDTATLSNYELLLRFTTNDVRLRKELVTDIHQVVSLVGNAVYGTASCMGLCDMTTNGVTWVIRNCYNCSGSEWSPTTRNPSILSMQYYSYQIAVQTAETLEAVLITLNGEDFKRIFSTWGTLKKVTAVSDTTNIDTLLDITTRSTESDSTDQIIGIVVTATSVIILISVGVWCYLTRTDDYILDNEKKKSDPDKPEEPLQTEASSFGKETTTPRPAESYFGDDDLELGPARSGVEEEDEPQQSI